MSFHNVSDSQLIAELEDLRTDTEDKFIRSCAILSELKTRKVKHPLHSHRVYRHYKAVSSGRILPGIVLLFSGDKWIVDLLTGLPHTAQQAIQAMRDMDVAEQSSDGRIVDRRKPFFKLSRAAMARAIPRQGHVATLSEQREALSKATVRETVRPAVEIVEDRLVLTKKSVPVSEIIAALESNGYKVTHEQR